MASLSSSTDGKRIVVFFDGKGQRRYLRLGRMAKRDAESIKTHVENIISARLAKRDPVDATARWMDEVEEPVRSRLVKFDLLTPKKSRRLGALIDDHIKSRRDLGPDSHRKMQLTRKFLVDYFGADRDIGSITEFDAARWLAELKTSRSWGQNTAAKHAAMAKQFFKSAVAAKLLKENVFQPLNATHQTNKDRQHFVSLETADKIMQACPHTQWKLMFALMRYGGLRAPSEMLRLTWSDVNWEQHKFLVRSKKTARHGKGTRWVPIFPELRPHLEAAFDEAAEGEIHVVTHCRTAEGKRRREFLSILHKAGVKPWEKLFQNLRSTRETELADQYPIHKVCSWIGNDEKTAREHYLQMRDSDYLAAAGAQQKAQQSLSFSRVQERSVRTRSSKKRVNPENDEPAPRLSETQPLCITPPPQPEGSPARSEAPTVAEDLRDSAVVHHATTAA